MEKNEFVIDLKNEIKKYDETFKKEYGPFETEKEEEIQLIKNNPYINIYRKTKNI